jgi:hypothetical protein
MSLEQPYTSHQPVDVLQVKTQLSQEFLGARPGWTESFVRHLADATLEVMRTDETIAFEAATVTSEFVTNAIKHGRMLSDFVLAHVPPGGVAPESVYIVATNPAQDTTSTPGTANRGKLASKEPNHTSTTGRGLQMTDAYTGHNWGQRNVVSPDGKQEIITFAVLSSSQAPDADFTFYEDVA